MESRSEDEIQAILKRYGSEFEFDVPDFLEKFINRVESPDFKLITRIVTLDIQLRRGPVTDSSPDNLSDFGDEFSMLVERVLRSQSNEEFSVASELTSAIQLDATSFDVGDDPSSETQAGDLARVDQPIRVPEMVIDRYRLIEPIGTGGMGTVWLAQQDEPVIGDL